MGEGTGRGWVVVVVEAVGDEAGGVVGARAVELAAERRVAVVGSEAVGAAVEAAVRGDGRLARRRVERLDGGAAVEAGSPALDLLVEGFRSADLALVTLDGDSRSAASALAARLAVALGAEEVELWTEAPGLFTADPRWVPSARLIRWLGWREARELAGLAGGPFDPRALRPLVEAGIPLALRGVGQPEVAGTRIGGGGEDGGEGPVVAALAVRRGETLVTLRSWEMWEAAGYLTRFFAPFAELGISVDLVATSEAAVSVTLHPLPDGVGGETFRRLLGRLAELGRVEVIHPCAVVAVVGRRIRSVLHEVGPALAAFREHPVHLVSDSSEDVNLSFVVDEEDAPALVARLHGDLFAVRAGDRRFGPTWEAIVAGRAAAAGEVEEPWWRTERERLLALVADGRARYAYHPATAALRARRLRAALSSVGRIYYSLKANPHPALVAAAVAEGFGLECVSAAEVRRAREVAGGSVPLLFTPNFCPLGEYAEAFAAGAEVVLAGPHLLAAAPEVFGGAAVGLRVDPGRGLGHHEKVRTAGAQAKFGTPLDEVGGFVEAAAALGSRVVGLHAHVGSGILDPTAWARTGRVLADLLPRFPDLAWIDLGGGLGVPQRPGDAPLDLAALEAALAPLAAALAPVELRLEPGRYLVSEAGVLLAPVTQVRRRGGLVFVGAATGMNSLLRPALYGAWHPIHNLTRLDEPAAESVHVVGPLCESSDVLGRDRLLPATLPGDVLLIENAGAYGAVMASRYNLREPAEEVVVDGDAALTTPARSPARSASAPAS
ncbi:MAG TPA: bifunctional aspartate kinase/diaminopimelate decarboxylase [Thermoanaerobaculia bacterium]